MTVLAVIDSQTGNAGRRKLALQRRYRLSDHRIAPETGFRLAILRHIR